MFSISKLTGFLYLVSLIPKAKYFLKIPKPLKFSIRILIFFYLVLVTVNFLNINNYSTDILQFPILLNIILLILLLNHEKLSPGVLEKGFISFFIGTLVTVVCFFLAIGTEINAEGRVSIFGDNENIIGIRTVISILILTHVIFNYKNKIPKLLFLLLPLLYLPLVVLMITTGSRLAFISLFFSLALIFLIYQKGSFLNKLFVIAFGSIVLLFIYNVALESEVLGARLLKTAESGNLAGRDEIWLSILPLIEGNLIFGVGRTGYVKYITSVYGYLRSPHNVIIEVLSYSGIIGLFLYFSFIFQAIFNSFRYYSITKNIIPIVFFVPIFGIILSAQILYLKLAYVIFAFGISRKLYLK